MRKFPTSARIAALSILMSLATNLTLLGFVYLNTHDGRLEQLRQRVVSNRDVMRDVFGTGGEATLSKAIQDTLRDNPGIVMAVYDVQGHRLIGNIMQPFKPAWRTTSELQTGQIRRAGESAPEQTGIVSSRLGPSTWLIVGEVFDDGLALQSILERSLLLAMLLSTIMGVVSGIAITAFVASRVSRIAAVVDDIGPGALQRRAELSVSGDAFDILSGRINAMLSRISDLMDELRLLTDSLAHDLRSPVSRLQTRIERALVEKDEGQREELLAGVLREADALMRILSTVLEITRSEAKTGVAQFAALDLGALVVEIGEMFEPMADESGTRLNVEAPALPVSFTGHRQLLAQALMNLLENALKYGSEGDAISLFVSVSGSEIRLGVVDAGPGIAAESMSEATKRFGRLDSARSIPGAGLGLTLADSVARLHSGNLVLSDAHPGLRAELVLPSAPASTSASGRKRRYSL